MRFERPKTLSATLTLLKTNNWEILAGGTDFYPGLKENVPRSSILDISALSELKKITFENGFWKIGALVTWSQLIGTQMPSAFQCLKLAAHEIGSIQIQNRATIVGNICNDP